MKYILILVFAFGVTSCKKCYHCQATPADEMDVCKGDARYDDIKKGQTFTDASGNPYVCN